MLIKVFDIIINTDKIQYLFQDGDNVTVAFGKGQWCDILNKTLVEVQVEMNRVTRERPGHVD